MRVFGVLRLPLRGRPTPTRPLLFVKTIRPLMVERDRALNRSVDMKSEAQAPMIVRACEKLVLVLELKVCP